MNRYYYYIMIVLCFLGVAVCKICGEELSGITLAILIAGAWISLEIKGDKE